jgi:hypothetical protein
VVVAKIYRAHTTITGRSPGWDGQPRARHCEAQLLLGGISNFTSQDCLGVVIKELEVVEGIQFDRGYISPYFVTNADKMQVDMEDPYILICEKKLSGLQELLPLLEAVPTAPDRAWPDCRVSNSGRLRDQASRRDMPRRPALRL